MGKAKTIKVPYMTQNQRRLSSLQSIERSLCKCAVPSSKLRRRVRIHSSHNPDTLYYLPVTRKDAKYCSSYRGQRNVSHGNSYVETTGFYFLSFLPDYHQNRTGRNYYQRCRKQPCVIVKTTTNKTTRGDYRENVSCEDLGGR